MNGTDGKDTRLGVRTPLSVPTRPARRQRSPEPQPEHAPEGNMWSSGIPTRSASGDASHPRVYLEPKVKIQKGPRPDGPVRAGETSADLIRYYIYIWFFFRCFAACDAAGNGTVK